MGILNRPQAGFVNAFTAHLHGYGGCSAGLEFCSAYTDYRGGDFAVRLEDEFPAAIFGFPCANEKGRELPVSVDGNLDAVIVGRRAPAAGQRGGEGNCKICRNKKEASLSTCLPAN